MLRHYLTSFLNSTLKWPPQQFRKFWIDWEVSTKMTDMPTSQTRIQLYSCADESVQNMIINTCPKFFTTNLDRLLPIIEALVTQKSNPMVRQVTFTSMSQHEDWPIQKYIVRLRAMATDYNFSCPHCEYDVSDIYIKDQCHAETFESALWDQTPMTDTLDVATIRILMYLRQKKSWLHGPTEVILILPPLLLATITFLNKNPVKSA